MLFWLPFLLRWERIASVRLLMLNISVAHDVHWHGIMTKVFRADTKVQWLK